MRGYYGGLLTVYLFMALVPFLVIGTLWEFFDALYCTIKAGVIPVCGSEWGEVAWAAGGTPFIYLYFVRYGLKAFGDDKTHEWLRGMEKAVWEYVTKRRSKEGRDVAEKLDPKHVTFEELISSTLYEQEATWRVLVRKELVTNKEILEEITAVRRELEVERGWKGKHERSQECPMNLLN